VRTNLHCCIQHPYLPNLCIPYLVVRTLLAMFHRSFHGCISGLPQVPKQAVGVMSRGYMISSALIRASSPRRRRDDPPSGDLQRRDRPWLECRERVFSPTWLLRVLKRFGVKTRSTIPIPLQTRQCPRKSASPPRPSISAFPHLIDVVRKWDHNCCNGNLHVISRFDD
jgi:hypothetical protein